MQSWLKIGCGAGFLVEMLTRMGYPLEQSLIDGMTSSFITAEILESAKKHLENKLVLGKGSSCWR